MDTIIMIGDRMTLRTPENQGQCTLSFLKISITYYTGSCDRPCSILYTPNMLYNAHVTELEEGMYNVSLHFHGDCYFKMPI